MRLDAYERLIYAEPIAVPPMKPQPPPNATVAILFTPLPIGIYVGFCIKGFLYRLLD